ncbi:MAG TPA: hypothetical protein ENJ00_00585 [Phycisphaerales bacterium]|nr:hypothetical protein [Phycisphaerales bacterium]
MSLLLIWGGVGCDNTARRLDAAVALAGSAGRAKAETALKADFDAGRITFESAMIRAEELLEADDPAAIPFAGAVLDLAVEIEDQLPSGQEFELFWRRIGRLAYHGAYAAYQARRYDDADALVLAGPKRWQRESYWLAYPNHDILVALSQAHRGDARAGIRRLEGRSVQADEFGPAIESLVEIDRRQLRERLRRRVEAEEESGG